MGGACLRSIFVLLRSSFFALFAMKTFSATLALAISLLSLPAHAQSGMSTENWKNIKVGPFFTAGAAINAGEVADGQKTSPRFSWAAGAKGYLPFSPSIG